MITKENEGRKQKSTALSQFFLLSSTIVPFVRREETKNDESSIHSTIASARGYLTEQCTYTSLFSIKAITPFILLRENLYVNSRVFLLSFFFSNVYICRLHSPNTAGNCQLKYESELRLDFSIEKVLEAHRRHLSFFFIHWISMTIEFERIKRYSLLITKQGKNESTFYHDRIEASIQVILIKAVGYLT